MRLDDGAANRQAHTQAAEFGRIEGVKDVIQISQVHSGSGILNRDDHKIRLCPCGADQQMAGAPVTRAYCFDGVDDQIQDHLLQLDSIAIDRRQIVRKSSLDQNAVLRRFTPG
jgi:hypothetical protein